MSRRVNIAFKYTVLLLLSSIVCGFLYYKVFLAALGISGKIILHVSDYLAVVTGHLGVLGLTAIVASCVAIWRGNLRDGCEANKLAPASDDHTKEKYKGIFCDYFMAWVLLGVTELYGLSVMLFGTATFKLSFAAILLFLAALFFIDKLQTSFKRVNKQKIQSPVLMASLCALAYYFAALGYEDAMQVATTQQAFNVDGKAYFLVKQLHSGILLKAPKSGQGDYLVLISGTQVMRFNYQAHEFKGLVNQASLLDTV